MQGFNMGRYVPPEHEGTTSANKLQGKHALGNRARKVKDGILTVRFEMPFAVWCKGCPRETLIGQGVRFNAEKKRVGSYHSTPIFAFRMRHAACGTTLEIQTDPKNTAYVVTEGGRKKDIGEDRATEGTVLQQFQTDEERARLREDAFAVLEVTIDDRKQAKAERQRIAELQQASERDWDDPYAANQNLRRSFRVGRKVRETQAKKDEALQERMSLGVAIAEETAEDRRRAGEVEFGLGDEESQAAEALHRARAKGIFARDDKPVGGTGSVSKKDSLRQVLSSNTRASVDPFTLQGLMAESRSRVIPGVKRKRKPSLPLVEPGSGPELTDAKGKVSLVNADYNSD